MGQQGGSQPNRTEALPAWERLQLLESPDFAPLASFTGRASLTGQAGFSGETSDTGEAPDPLEGASRLKPTNSLFSLADSSASQWEELDSGFSICQPKVGFRFGEDSVLLARFAARFASRRRLRQLGDCFAGTAVVSLLFCLQRRKEREGKDSLARLKLLAVERSPQMLPYLLKNFQTAKQQLGLEVEVWRGDLRGEAPEELKGKLEVVLANPPYAAAQRGENPQTMAEARVEEEAALPAYCRSMTSLLADKGQLFLCHRAQRLPEVLAAVQAAGLEPRRLQLVQSRAEKSARLMLLEAQKGRRAGGFELLPPLILSASIKL